MNVIAFASRKGGTGKSTLAAHLAACASTAANPCVLLDGDPQGSLSLWRRLRRGDDGPEVQAVTNGVQGAIAAARKQGRRWVLIDTPPNMSRIVTEAIRAATLVVIPARPAVFDLVAVQDTIEFASELGKPYMVAINAAPAKRDAVESPLVTQSRHSLEKLGVPVWAGQITHRNDFSLTLAEGMSVADSAEAASASTEIRRLWSAISRSALAINRSHEASANAA